MRNARHVASFYKSHQKLEFIVYIPFGQNLATKEYGKCSPQPSSRSPVLLNIEASLKTIEEFESSLHRSMMSV